MATKLYNEPAVDARSSVPLSPFFVVADKVVICIEDTAQNRGYEEEREKSLWNENAVQYAADLLGGTPVIKPLKKKVWRDGRIIGENAFRQRGTIVLPDGGELRCSFGRRCRVNPHMSSLGTIHVTMPMKNGYPAHHARLHALQIILDQHLFLDWHIASAETTIITSNEKLGAAIRMFALPKHRRKNMAWYWDNERAERGEQERGWSGRKDGIVPGYALKGNNQYYYSRKSAYQISGYEAKMTHEIQYRFEGKWKGTVLRKNEIRKVTDLFERAGNLITSKVAWYEPNVDRLEADFSVAEMADLLEAIVNYPIGLLIEKIRLLRPRLTITEIVQRYLTPWPLRPLHTINCNNNTNRLASPFSHDTTKILQNSASHADSITIPENETKIQTAPEVTRNDANVKSSEIEIARKERTDSEPTKCRRRSLKNFYHILLWILCSCFQKRQYALVFHRLRRKRGVVFRPRTGPSRLRFQGFKNQRGPPNNLERCQA